MRTAGLLLAFVFVVVPWRSSASEATPQRPSPTPLAPRCSAESPTDDACVSYGGTYRIILGPAVPDDDPACVVTRPVTATVTLDGDATFQGKGHATQLDPLGKALGLRKKPDHRLGASIRDGVCCVDLELHDETGSGRTVKVYLARGKSVVSAKAKDWTGAKECIGRPAVEVQLVDPPPGAGSSQ